MAIKKIGILTSGGDCGGLNAVIRGAASRALHYGIEPYLIPNGYAGLYNLLDFSSLVLLNERRLETFFSFFAGSEAGNSRVKISKIIDTNKYQHIRKGLAKFDIDALVIAGGDDTGSVVVDLSKEKIPCVHVPKTMDLDLAPYSVGGDSTINRIASFAKDLRTSGETHNRIMVMEVFGRYAGHTAFRGGIAAQADVILIPEIQVDFKVIYKRCKELLCRRIQESDNHAGMVLLIVAEGLKDVSGAEIIDKNALPDSFGHRPLIGAGKYVTKELEGYLKKDGDLKTFMESTKQFVEALYETPEVREVRPGHLVRCGYSSALDISFGMEVGVGAIDLIRENIFGVTVVSYREGKLEYMKCVDAIKQRHVDIADIELYESLGICFGRQSQVPSNKEKQWEGERKMIQGKPVRPY